MMARLTLRNLMAHKVRLGLTALAVILGVAFVSGTMIFKDTMTRSFDELFSQIGKGTDVVVRVKQAFDTGSESSGRPIPASLAETVRAKVPDAEKVHGSVTGYAAVVGGDGKVVGTQGPPQLGGEWIDDPDFSPLTIVSGHPPRAPDEVAIDSVTADKGRLRTGDRVAVLLHGSRQSMRLSGVFRFGTAGNLGGASYATFAPEVAQRLLVQPGHYSEIQVHARDGVSQERLRDEVAAVLPGGMEAITGHHLTEERKADISEVLDFIGIFLLVFAGVAIFVGSFIIFNTFSMLVAQRTRELALLRAVGAGRGQVTRAVMGEALGVGLFGSTAGLLAGAGLAVGLRALFKVFGADLPATGLVYTPATLVWAYVVGSTVTLTAAYLPARRAAKIPPVAALRDEVALPARSLRLRVIEGAVLTVAGAVAMGIGFAASGPTAGYLVGTGAALVFLGVAMLSPVVSRPVTRVLGWPFARLFGFSGRLARENAQRNPRRTAATASALMIGLALVATISVLAQSMKASVDKAFDEHMGADFTVAASTFAGFSPKVTDAVAAVPGVSDTTPARMGAIKLNGQRTFAMVADPPTLVKPLGIEMESGTDSPAKDELLVQRKTADDRHWDVGTIVPGQYPDGARARFRIAGIMATNPMGMPVIISPAGYSAHDPNDMVQAVYVGLDTDTDKAQARTALENALKPWPNLKIQDRQDMKAQTRKNVNQLLSMVIVLLVLSIIIAALGIVNTLALSVIERTREVGLLRAVGMSRRQLRRTVRYESVVIAFFGAVLGLGIGVVFGWALQAALADEGVDVLSVPFGQLLGCVAAAGVIGVVAAIWPARRAARMDVLRAIAAE